MEHPYASLQPASPSCLIAVDMQHQFLNAHTRHILPGVQALVDRFDYVVCSRYVHLEGGPVERFKKWEGAGENTLGAQLAINLDARPGSRTRVLEKHYFGAFSPEVREWVLNHGIEEVYVCGMDTDICVLKTLFDIVETGLRPIVLKDLTATYAGEPCYSHGMLSIKRLVGREQILDASEVVAEYQSEQAYHI